jgi:ABC-type glycerol-3-phosphate transport system substrate-binding protein
MHYVQYQGHIYGMPLDMHGWGFYFNPTLLQKAGLPLRSPNSGEELTMWARKLTTDKHGNNALSKSFDSGNVKVYGLATSWDAPPTFLTTLWSFGGNTLSADGKKALFDTPQMRDAVNFWYDLIFKYHAVSKPAAYGANGPWSAYANSALAMIPDGDWMRNWFPLHRNVKVQCVFMPVFGSKRVAWMSGHVISCPAGLSGDKKTAAYTFMRWLSGKGLQWTSGAGHIPARISQRKSRAVMALWPQKVYGPELAEIGRIEQPSTVFFDVQGAYVPAIDGAWNGTKSVSTSLSDAQSAVTRALSHM